MHNRTLQRIPVYAALNAWLLFTVFVIGWIFVASVSTTPGIFSGAVLSSGFHPSNYSKALFTHNVATYFLNSLLYTGSACVGVIIIAAPAAYVLARFDFRLNKTLQAMFVSALGIPQIMIILPLFALVTRVGLTNSRAVLITLYMCINVPFTLFFLIAFFQTIPSTYEDAAAIDGCTPMPNLFGALLCL